MASTSSGSVQIYGLTRVTRDLRGVGVDVEDLKDAFADVALMGARTAARYAPKRTGQLARDIRGNRAASKAVVTAGRARVPYAGAINYGWRKRNISAAGFMQKADRAIAPFAYRRLLTGIDRAISRRGLT